MHANISSHNSAKGVSSGNVFDYLEKENRLEKIGNNNLILEGREEEINPLSEEHFFNQDFNPYDLNDKNSLISQFEAASEIDTNRGTQNLKSSNFYMLNINPSIAEQLHMEKIAVEELNNRGLVFEQVKDNPQALEFYEEQKQQLIKLEMKLFTQDIMNEYANQMDREIYVNQESLPDNSKRKELKPLIESRYDQFLIEKGFDVEMKKEKELIKVEDFKVVKEYDSGKMFSLYSDELNRDINIYVPNSKFLIDDNNLQIDELYFTDKVNAIVKDDFLNREIIVIGEGEKNNDAFIDFVTKSKLSITETFKEHEINLYFDQSEYKMSGGIASVNSEIYKNKLYEAKRSYFSKTFADKREEIYSANLIKAGLNIEKNTNQFGKEISNKELRNVKTQTSVDFNNFLVDEGLMERREGFKISNWDHTTIKASVLQESKSAKLLEIQDSRLNDKVQIWVGNFALDVESIPENVSKDDLIEIGIVKEFYDSKINDFIKVETAELKEFTDFKEFKYNREIKVSDVESVKFSIEVEQFKKPVTFSVAHSDLGSSSDQYTMSRGNFEMKRDHHIYLQAKEEFPKVYEEIVNNVNKEFLAEKTNVIDRKIETQFKAFLTDQDILSSKKNEKYFFESTVEKTKNNCTMLSVKTGEDEKVQFWVNNQIITGKVDNGLIFRNEDEINKLFNQAVERDTISKTLVEIKHETFKVLEPVLKADGTEKNPEMQIFISKVNGLNEPIELKFPKAELIEKDGKFFIEQFKYDYKMKNELSKGIEKEFGNVKDTIKNEVWKEAGFDVSKRKVEGKDLLYFAKVETERIYKHTDKSVIKNKEIFKELKDLKKNIINRDHIAKLEKQLLKDPHTNEVIKEGLKKGGLNYHAHIIVSRHDKTSINPLDKVSMSPNANQKEGTLNNGAKVGFDRVQFFEKIEKIFDKKFEYVRPVKEQFKYINNENKYLKGRITGQVKNLVKQQIMKETGMQTVKSELMPIHQIKSQIMPLPIPTSLPKNKVDLAVKAIKLVMGLVKDRGLGY